MPPLTGLTLANFIADSLLDVGIVRVGSTNIGVTKGGIDVDPGWEIQPIDFDGRDTPVKGLDRKFYGEPMVSFSMIEFGPAATGAQVAKFEAGSAAVTSGTTPNTKTVVTPQAGRILYVAGNYMTDVRLLVPLSLAVAAGAKTYWSFYMACALVKKWTLKTAEKSEGLISVQFAGRKDMASGTTADAPYALEWLESLP